MGKDRKINSLRFNQDQGCFTCAMESGSRVYNIEPLVEQAQYSIELVGSVSKCEMLYRTNLIAFVSGGSRPKFADNKLYIYDDKAKKFILEISFQSSITAVRLRKDKLVVAQLNEIHVFLFPSPTQKLFSVGTIRNPRGLLELSPLESCEKQIMVFPGHKLGSVQIVDMSGTENGISVAPVWINAHKAELQCIAINQQATKIATASATGTLIRIWDVANKTKLIELRRGADTATIYCLNFSKSSEYLCCSSDKGTVHIFAIKNPGLNKKMNSTTSKLLGDYGNSLWAMANFTVPPERPCICAFTPNNSVIALCLEGEFYKYVFNQNGNCNREAYNIFLDICNDDGDLLL